MKQFFAITLACSLISGASAFGANPLGSILEPVQAPSGQGSTRAASPEAKTPPHSITESDLIDRLQGELVKAFNLDGELRLTFGRQWHPVRVPSSDWQISLPDLPIGGLSKSFILRVRINAGDRIWFDQQLVMQAQLWKQVYVASRRLERGQAMDTTSAEIQVTDVLRERLTPLSPTTKLEDCEILQTVVEGRPLTAKDVAPIPYVRKGAIVDVTAGDGSMSINMKGTAMGTGSQGDVITVRNMDTRKDFRARIVDRNSVRVTF